MTDQMPLRRNAASALLPAATAALAIGIFIADILLPSDIVVTVLYVAVVLMATRFTQSRGVVLAAAGCSGLAVISYVLSAETASNTALGILAIALTTATSGRRINSGLNPPWSGKPHRCRGVSATRSRALQ